MKNIGIDIGSSCAKVCVMDNDIIETNFMLPTGYNSRKTAEDIRQMLEKSGIDIENSNIMATGYGRVSVPYANEIMTEISCHGKGAYYLFGENATVIDIGGQDTKVISLKKGRVMKFLMNDKCSAGTGRFLDIMAGTLGVSLEELSELARNSKKHMSISSMCTVFAESEVVSLIGRGEKKEDIAYAILDSITTKVRGQMGKLALSAKEVVLTGGLCEIPFIREMLSQKISTTIESDPLARYAGAIGASLYAVKLN